MEVRIWDLVHRDGLRFLYAGEYKEDVSIPSPPQKKQVKQNSYIVSARIYEPQFPHPPIIQEMETRKWDELPYVL